MGGRSLGMPSFFVISVSPRIAFELLFETIHEKNATESRSQAFSRSLQCYAFKYYLNKLIYKPAIMYDVITPQMFAPKFFLVISINECVISADFQYIY